MRAYFVYDEPKDMDRLVLPENDLLVSVDRKVMEEFIAVQPDFSQWPGKPISGLAPENFGRIVATRDEKGDVCIVEPTLWQQRMVHYLGVS